MRTGSMGSKSAVILTSNVLRMCVPGPPIYYFTGFDLASHYESRDVLDEALHGRDKSAPEHQSQRHCNPFQVDIYHIGNLVRQEFMEVRLASCPRFRELIHSSHPRRYVTGFDFMEDLIHSMTIEDPTRRPVIEKVLEEFVSI